MAFINDFKHIRTDSFSLYMSFQKYENHLKNAPEWE